MGMGGDKKRLLIHNRLSHIVYSYFCKLNIIHCYLITVSIQLNINYLFIKFYARQYSLYTDAYVHVNCYAQGIRPV